MTRITSNHEEFCGSYTTYPDTKEKDGLIDMTSIIYLLPCIYRIDAVGLNKRTDSNTGTFEVNNDPVLFEVRRRARYLKRLALW